MSEIPVLDVQGKKVASVKLDDAYLKPRVSKQVVQDAVVGLRANQRRGTACTKTKAEIAFSGAKPWKQKGTGRARSGERSSPIWRKGSVAHGPRPHSFRKIVNKKVKSAALHVALADKIKQNQLVLVDKIAVAEPKTKLLVGFLNKWNVMPTAIIVLEKADKKLQLAARNIPGISTQSADTVSLYEILAHKRLVTTPAGLDSLKARSLKGGAA